MPPDALPSIDTTARVLISPHTRVARRARWTMELVANGLVPLCELATPIFTTSSACASMRLGQQGWGCADEAHMHHPGRYWGPHGARTGWRSPASISSVIHVREFSRLPLELVRGPLGQKAWMVESRDEVSNDGGIRQFQGEKTALGLYRVCTAELPAPRGCFRRYRMAARLRIPLLYNPVSVHFVPTRQMPKCYAHSNTPRGDDSSCWVEGTKIGSRWSPATFIQLRVQGASSHRTLAGEKKRVSNGGCCWLRHVSTVAPCVDMSSTYDLPVLFCLVLPVQKASNSPLADSHASRVGVSDFPETSDCSRCSQAVLVQLPYDTGCKREAKRKMTPSRIFPIARVACTHVRHVLGQKQHPGVGKTDRAVVSI